MIAYGYNFLWLNFFLYNLLQAQKPSAQIVRDYQEVVYYSVNTGIEALISFR